jgi:propanol-preferring alcohol dehydrogenase
MVLEAPGRPLRLVERAVPEPGLGELLLEVRACGVCRTDLHLLDGELDVPAPRVLGHQIVGVVAGEDRRVGVPWLGWTCGECAYCRSGRENLCVRARFTGRDVDGGFADHAVADERFCLPIPDGYPDLQAAPLLCAGLIGYRALRMCGDAERLGLYGFGAAAHIICQVAVWQGRRVFAFTRAGDDDAQALARELGAEWVGVSGELPPRAARRGADLRPGGPARAGRAARARARRDRRLRRHPHERHPIVPVRAALAGAQPPLGRQPHP